MSENLIRRKSKVSDGRSVRVGLGGPKPRLRSVGDGQQVNIPAPVVCWLWRLIEGEALSGLCVAG